MSKAFDCVSESVLHRTSATDSDSDSLANWLFYLTALYEFWLTDWLINWLIDYWGWLTRRHCDGLWCDGLLLQPSVVSHASMEHAVLTSTSASVAMVTPAPAVAQVCLCSRFIPLMPLLLTLTPTVSVGVGRICESVCLFVCLFVRSMTKKWSKSVQTWYREWHWDILQVIWFWVEMSKVKVRDRVGLTLMSAA